MTPVTIPFAALHLREDQADVRAAIDRVLASGWFVLGPEVEAFEAAFALASGTRFAIGVGNGTDAIALLLRAAGIGPGDDVIIPAMTAAFTALAVLSAGATPVMIDVDPDTLTLSAAACLAAVTPRTRAIVPVHLYGQPADLDAVFSVADRHSLLVVEDCCQAHLATHNGAAVGSRGAGGAFSFYPTKNLGALGDGGAVVTNDPALASAVRRLRNGGQSDRYHHVDPGINSRLDELQAAVLRARLPRLAEGTRRRRALAATYRRAMPPGVTPIAERDPGHVYHLFAARSGNRDALQAHLRQAGIETLIHYPVPLHQQPALSAFAGEPCPVATQAAHELLSLPLRPDLTDREVLRIVEAMDGFMKGRRLS